MFLSTGAPEGRVCTTGAGSAVLARVSVAPACTRGCCTGLGGLILPAGSGALVLAQATGAVGMLVAIAGALVFAGARVALLS